MSSIRSRSLPLRSSLLLTRTISNQITNLFFHLFLHSVISLPYISFIFLPFSTYLLIIVSVMYPCAIDSHTVIRLQSACINLDNRSHPLTICLHIFTKIGEQFLKAWYFQKYFSSFTCINITLFKSKYGVDGDRLRYQICMCFNICDSIQVHYKEALVEALINIKA